MSNIHCLNVHYDHPEKGQTEIAVSDHSLSVMEQTYVGDTALQHALRQLGVTTQPVSAVVELVQHSWGHGWVVGCSGYATDGFDCTDEERVLRRLYQHLADTARLPMLTVDGGGGAGVLGLNGTIATQFNVPTLGCTPLSALPKSDLAPRTHTLIWGATYQTREELVGTLPDILVCVGGGDGARRECETAASLGSVVLLVMPRPYKNSLIDTYSQFPKLQQAADQKRLVVCRPKDDIVAKVNQALTASYQTNPASRPVRLRRLAQLLVS